jgi:hypothetical protein
MHGDQEIIWVERRLLIRLLAHAKSSEVALYARLQMALCAIQALTERRLSAVGTTCVAVSIKLTLSDPTGRVHWASLRVPITRAGALTIKHPPTPLNLPW